MLRIFEMELHMNIASAGYKSHRVGKRSNNHRRSHNKNSKPETCDSRSFGTTGVNFVELCNCDVLPWGDCEHTEDDAIKSMRIILSMEPLEEFYCS